MTYSRRPPTWPQGLVGHYVWWSPRNPEGKRFAPVMGHVVAYDAEARTLTIEVQREVSAWQPNPTQVITLPLSAGPFRRASAS